MIFDHRHAAHFFNVLILPQARIASPRCVLGMAEAPTPGSFRSAGRAPGVSGALNRNGGFLRFLGRALRIVARPIVARNGGMAHLRGFLGFCRLIASEAVIAAAIGARAVKHPPIPPLPRGHLPMPLAHARGQIFENRSTKLPFQNMKAVSNQQNGTKVFGKRRVGVGGARQNCMAGGGQAGALNHAQCGLGDGGHRLLVRAYGVESVKLGRGCTRVNTR